MLVGQLRLCHAGERAFVACQHIDRLDFVASSGSKVLGVVVLVSCRHCVVEHEACQAVVEAWQRRLLESRERHQDQHHSRCQQAQEHSGRPAEDLVIKVKRYMDGQATYLNEVLAFWLGDKWLQLWCCESVDQTCFGDNEKKDLSSSEDGEFISLSIECWLVYSMSSVDVGAAYLLHDTSFPLRECDVTT